MEYALALRLNLFFLIMLMSLFLYCVNKRRYVRIVLTGTVLIMAFNLYYPLVVDHFGRGGVVGNAALSLYHALKLFIMDGEFDSIREMVSSAGMDARTAAQYENWMIALHVAAPITTAAMIISLFKSVTAFIRLYIGGMFGRVYVFSELNDKALALAQDIHRKNSDYFHTIVFHDVYGKNEEKHAELMEKVEAIGGICFRFDVRRLKTGVFPLRIEYYIIGASEAENIDQVIALVNRYRQRKNIRLYVWARNPESVSILDSLDLPDIPADAPKGFRLRRIDDIEVFVWNTLWDADLFSKASPFEDKKLISVLIIGMGEYGTAFLKACAWMYQMEGVRLEINVLDMDDKVEKKLRHQCPELLSMNDCTIPGESKYSIRFIEKVNVFEEGFDDLLFGRNGADPKITQRLRRTTAVFITLGDDDTNIRAALELRGMFDRLSFKDQLEFAKADAEKIGKTAKVGKLLSERYRKLAVPAIYSPVYDILKSSNIRLVNTQDESGCGLRTYDDDPYNVVFRGSFEEQYRYDTIIRGKLEADACAYHLQWAGEEDYEAEKCKYNQYEYFRKSSMAQALHKAMVTERFRESLECVKKDADPKKCACENCERARRVEHMRWNAYMRAEGFCRPETDHQSYGIKLPRARLHYELVAYDRLIEDKEKDSTIRKQATPAGQAESGRV